MKYYNRNYDPNPRFFNIGKEPIIGKSCSLVDVLLDCYDQITIGDYVSFGHDCKVLTAYHNMYLFGEERQNRIYAKPIVIENGVWIASGVTICAGVTIGKNAVIGANSLVMYDVAEDSFYAGTPARFVKFLR